jgi:hypothetical protein
MATVLMLMNISSFNLKPFESLNIKQFEKWLKRNSDHQQIIVEFRIDCEEPGPCKIDKSYLCLKADGVAPVLSNKVIMNF